MFPVLKEFKFRSTQLGQKARKLYPTDFSFAAFTYQDDLLVFMKLRAYNVFTSFFIIHLDAVATK